MLKNIFSVEINPKRIYGLDILRALAILFVVIGHGRYLLPKKIDFFQKVFVFDGVTIFFVLSGFLIGGILIKILENNKPSFKVLIDFWIRRWFRTLPNYILILTVLVIGYALFTNKLVADNIPVWKYYIFSQNLLSAHPPFFQEAWSLSVEEWFYLSVPVGIFIVLGISRLNVRQSVITCIAIVLISSTALRCYIYLNVEISDISKWDLVLRKIVLTRLDSLVIGVFGAVVKYYFFSTWFKQKNTFFVIGLLMFLVHHLISLFSLFEPSSFYMCVISFLMISLATLMILPFLCEIKSGKGFVFKSITVISLISYSMYLLNLSVIQFIVIDNIPWNLITDDVIIISILNYLIFWTLTVSVSILMYKYFEIPTTKIRDSKTVKNFLSKL